MGIARTRLALGTAAVVVVIGSSAMVMPSAAADDAVDDAPAATTTTTVPEATTTEGTSAVAASAEPTAATDSTTAATAPSPPTTSGPKIQFVPVKRYNVRRKLVFPVVGVTAYGPSFGACRDGCTREHHGIDISAYGYKGLPVVAAHDGTVVKVTYDEGNPGCSVRIRGRDRWETRYYHLNNDMAGTDEIGGPCPAPGIEVGTEVKAGQIIGYLGDSGNAEETTPHLHFELRSRSGYPIDPYRSLKAAKRVTFEWLPTDPQAATILLSSSMFDTARTVTLIGTDEVDQLGRSEQGSTDLMAPLIAVDPSNPGPAIVEIQRLAPEHIVVLSENPTQWLEELARPLAPLVARSGIPRPPATDVQVVPAALEAAPAAPNPRDRFTTIVAGVVDRIWKSRKPAYEEFVADHRSVVLETERWAPYRIGTRTWSTPGKHADTDLLWWLTGDGWVGTEHFDDAPYPGMAYVREKSAQPQTLTYLASLTELHPFPVWKAS